MELKAHLEHTRDKFDVTNLFDRSGYSPLHFAAYKNSDRLCEILCEFILTRGLNEDKISEEDKQLRKEKLSWWINQHSRGEEGFTAMHFASFHGNMKLIRYLKLYGANVFAKNKQEINMLHVAAQGDQPASLAFFI